MTNPGVFSQVAGTQQLTSDDEFSVLYAQPSAPVLPTLLRIDSQPADVLANPGDAISFSIAASGLAPIWYSWFIDGIEVGLFTPVINVVAGSQDRRYAVRVHNNLGSILSQAAHLHVYGAPQITSQPQNVTALDGVLVAFSVAIITHSPATYQWFFDDNPTEIRTATYNLLASALTEGTYKCVITNASGSATSLPATLTVENVDAPVISQGPASVSVQEHSSAQFTVTATGTSLRYAWFKDGVSLAVDSSVLGADTDTLTIPDVGHAAAVETFQFSVTVTNAGGTASATAQLTVRPLPVPPSILTQPGPLAVAEGATATFSVAASGDGLTYQWQRFTEGVWVPITDATSAAYSLVTVLGDDAAQFNVVITGTVYGEVVGVVTSATATLSVFALPAITVQPVSQTLDNVTAATFSVTATGAGLAYQWYEASTLIVGATSASYTAGVKPVGSYSYTCHVSNVAGVVVSDPATLAVVSRVSIAVQPVSVDVSTGSTATLYVIAGGTRPAYQWYHFDTGTATWLVLSGKTTSTLSLVGVTTSDDGIYRVVVTGDLNQVTSAAASVAVAVQPAITVQPASQTAAAGDIVALSVTATGTHLTYQWYRAGSAISGATSSTHSVVASGPGTVTAYHVVVSGVLGLTTPVASATASIAVRPALDAVETAVGSFWDATNPLAATARLVVSPGWYRIVYGDGAVCYNTDYHDPLTGHLRWNVNYSADYGFIFSYQSVSGWVYPQWPGHSFTNEYVGSVGPDGVDDVRGQNYLVTTAVFYTTGTISMLFSCFQPSKTSFDASGYGLGSDFHPVFNLIRVG